MGGKKCLMVSNVCLAALTLGFGFCTNLWSCIALRFLSGCVMGQSVICNVVIANFCTKDNVATGMSYSRVGWLAGTLLGPALGGFLVFPGNQHPRVFGPNNVFSKYVLLLPSVVVASSVALVLLLTIVFLPDNPEKLCESEEKAEDELLLCDERDSENESKSGALATEPEAEQSENDNTRSSLMNSVRKSGFFKVCTTRETVLVICANCGFSIASIGFRECLILLLTTSHTNQGMGWSPSDIGIIFLMETAITLSF